MQYGKFCGSANKCPTKDTAPFDGGAGDPCHDDFLDLKCKDHDVCLKVASKVGRHRRVNEECKCDLALLANFVDVARGGDDRFPAPQKELCDEEFYKERIPDPDFGPNTNVDFLVGSLQLNVPEVEPIILSYCEDFLDKCTFKDGLGKTVPSVGFGGYQPVLRFNFELDFTFAVKDCSTFKALFGCIANPTNPGCFGN